MVDMDPIKYAHDLSRADAVVLANLEDDIQRHSPPSHANAGTNVSSARNGSATTTVVQDKTATAGETPRDTAHSLKRLQDLNNPTSADFEPSVFVSVDWNDVPRKVHPVIYQYLLKPYHSWASGVVRNKADVVMVTHLILYFTTSVPSAVLLFRHFSYLHAVLHAAMQFYYVGTYTLMMHQHIHMRGILAKGFWTGLFDTVFPYITDPLMGHTWNTYFYHHVKHHHVEGNGPDDLSSTIRYQRDNVWHFLHYIGRFYFLIWLDLPRYFISKGRATTALRAGFWELSNYAALYTMWQINGRAAFFVFLLPLMLMRIGLMVGNWGQHALVDADEPDSDYRSSITLIDVPSNRYCFNDGYHTSHHLNPLRHWRDHPVHFLQQKETYAREHALVFHDIDYIMITVKILMHDYEHLARRLVPIGDAQMAMTLEEKTALLRRCTRRFSEEEIQAKFGASKTK